MERSDRQSGQFHITSHHSTSTNDPPDEEEENEGQVRQQRWGFEFTWRRKIKGKKMEISKESEMTEKKQEKEEY